MIWSPSTSFPSASTASMRSPSPSKATPRSASPPRHHPRSSQRSVAPQPTLMFVPSGSSPTSDDVRPSRSSTAGATWYIAPFAQSSRDPQARERRAEALADHLDVLLAHPRPSTRSAAVGSPGASSSCLDRLLLARPSSFQPPREELDPVVLGRIVRGGDDRAARARASSATAGVGRIPPETASAPA